MIRNWTGSRRVAFIPVWNRQVDNEPPQDWTNQVRSRIFFDPDPATGMDRSLQRYIQTASSGKAYLEGRVFPTVAADDADTVGAGLNSLPSSHDYEYAMIILPHSTGLHRGGYAWYDGPATNGISNFARVAMFTDPQLSNRDTLGVWMMEVLHIATSFGDLYYTNPMLGDYDVMACSCGSHPSAHTKSLIGWVDPDSIRTHALNTNGNHSLHAVSLFQPPPSWRSTAVRIESRTTNGHFLVEARLRTDPYESNSAVSDGIPAEGVIVYEVQGDTQIFLRTPGALQVGGKFEDAEEKLEVSVIAAEPGGFRVRVEAGGIDRCIILANKIKSLDGQLEFETDYHERVRIFKDLQQARADYRRFGCPLIHNTDNDEVFLARFFGPKAGRSEGKGYEADPK